MRFLINKENTTRWDELSPEILIDFAKNAGAIEDKFAEKQVKDWLKEAKNGDVFTLGVYKIVAVNV